MVLVISVCPSVCENSSDIDSNPTVQTVPGASEHQKSRLTHLEDEDGSPTNQGNTVGSHITPRQPIETLDPMDKVNIMSPENNHHSTTSLQNKSKSNQSTNSSEGNSKTDLPTRESRPRDQIIPPRYSRHLDDTFANSPITGYQLPKSEYDLHTGNDPGAYDTDGYGSIDPNMGSDIKQGQNDPTHSMLSVNKTLMDGLLELAKCRTICPNQVSQSNLLYVAVFYVSMFLCGYVLPNNKFNIYW